MVRIIIKGGVWKNTEDEILKAAISKYGKNQWARISSLLVRKTPKQCKARWYEWLDPSIKKTEWSKEEDEKLLHLAKLMPTQWRTIAPIVGRTATQCLERYQKLLDDAEARDNQEASGSGGLGLSGPGDEAAPSAEDIRRLRPGEIDPDPETKPARPDPIDMDEDEKEMLSEARARLANTQGKKAKRKARERALDEARRLAMLQKRRELKAAGIIMRGKKKTKGIDYNADIPYERAPAAGFYDTTDEANRTYATPVGRTMRELDRKVRPADLDADKKKRQREADARKSGGDAKPFGDAGKEEHIRKIREAAQISKRRKLDLPAAQVGEAELDEIVKLGRVGQSARDLVSDGGNEATAGLLGEYEALERAKHARTPMVAPEEDTVMREARNARNRIAQQTPLLGDANATMYEGTGALGATPQRSVAQTPNPLLTPAHGARMGDPGATPLTVRGGSGGINGRAWSEAGSATPSIANQTPLRTPLRDTLGLNSDDGQSVMSETPRGEKHARSALRRELQMGLKSLPAPVNAFDIVMEEEEAPSDEVAAQRSADDELRSILGEFTGEEDASERDARIARAKEELARREFARRSMAVQRGLPRPSVLDGQQLLDALRKRPLGAAAGEIARAQRLVDEEMVALLVHDSIVHPAPGSTVPGGQKSFLPTVPDSALEAARALVDAELGASVGFPGARGPVLKRLTASLLEGDGEEDAGKLGAFEAALAARREDEVWSAAYQGWVSRDEIDSADLLRGYEDQLARARTRMVQSAAAAAKEEKRLGKILGGYQAVAGAQATKLREDTIALEEAAFTHAVFERLSLQEENAVKERSEALLAEVEGLERTYAQAQTRYRDVEGKREELERECEEMEQEIMMREAEKANEMALMEMDEDRSVGAEGGDEEDDVGPPPPQE